MDPLTCRKCQKTFSVKQALQRHLKNRHGVQTKVKCPLCRNFFTRYEGLQKHFGLKHAINLCDGMDIEMYTTRGDGELVYKKTRTYFAPKRERQTGETRPGTSSEERPGYCTMQYVSSLEAVRDIADSEQERILETSLEILENAAQSTQIPGTSIGGQTPEQIAYK